MIINSDNLKENETLDIGASLIQGYVLTLQEYGNFESFSPAHFFIFVIFSFFVPILLLNMLIAIMSDSYERVMANATPADCR